MILDRPELNNLLHKDFIYHWLDYKCESEGYDSRSPQDFKSEPYSDYDCYDAKYLWNDKIDLLKNGIASDKKIYELCKIKYLKHIEKCTHADFVRCVKLFKKIDYLVKMYLISECDHNSDYDNLKEFLKVEKNTN